jgi:hypothetical protein
MFATPDSSYFVGSVAGGVLHFFRVPPPPGTTNQGVVFQRTLQTLASGEELIATFQLGNSSNVRKRVSVLIHNDNFSDLMLCAFWLAPQTPLRQYRMRGFTTQAWTATTLAFYAATPGTNGGNYLLDNVTLEHAPSGAAGETDCTDPNAPGPVSIDGGNNFLFNGDFSSGAPAPWILFGSIVGSISPGGVMSFYRATAASSAVLQPTGLPIPANQIVTVTLLMGNTSTSRRRVTLLAHDVDFSDSFVCTFWLPGGQPLTEYRIRGYTTRAWANATFSVYPVQVTQPNAGLFLLDDVVLRNTPAQFTVGTECDDPTSPQMLMTPAAADSVVSIPLGAPASPVISGSVRGQATSIDMTSRSETSDASSPVLERRARRDAGETAIPWEAEIDLRLSTAATLVFESRLDAWDPGPDIQVSVDGADWMAIGVLAPEEASQPVAVDLAAFVGHVVRIRLAFDARTLANPGARFWPLGVRLVQVR